MIGMIGVWISSILRDWRMGDQSPTVDRACQDRYTGEMKQSAGTLLYRGPRDRLEVLLVHPSGAYNRNSPWGIPKGMPDPGEALEDAARRETREETGISVEGPLVPLDSITYAKSPKQVYCFAGPAPAVPVPACASWEIDGARFMTLEEARNLIHPDQGPFLDRLKDLLRRE
jgi:predicted NUDIX family NTP pyrophosphohydrolase